MSYKLVPLEPTPEMEAAYKNGDGTHVGLYRAMVEAAPAAPVELEPVGYFYIDERGFWEQAGDPRGFPSMTPLYDMPPDAAAVIAAKDAEIERLKEERLGVISQSNMHPSWLEKSREEILDCLRFQGRTTALLLAETAELREQLAAKDAEISELQQNVQTTADALGHAHLELAVKQQQINAFYSGNPNGGIVAGLQEQLAAVEKLLSLFVNVADHWLGATANDRTKYAEARQRTIMAFKQTDDAMKGEQK